MTVEVFTVSKLWQCRLAKTNDQRMLLNTDEMDIPVTGKSQVFDVFKKAVHLEWDTLLFFYCVMMSCRLECYRLSGLCIGFSICRSRSDQLDVCGLPCRYEALESIINRESIAVRPINNRNSMLSRFVNVISALIAECPNTSCVSIT